MCNICCNNKINNILKCKTCKNCICDLCYANIIYNHDKFQFNFNNDKIIYKCPFCVSENILSPKINNYNTNNKLIKLLLSTKNTNDIEFNNLVDDINTVRNLNKKLSDENEELKNKLYNLRSFNSDILDEIKALKNELKYKNKNNELLEIEYKPTEIEKFKKIEQLIKNTKKETILFNKINYILTNK